MDNKIQHSLNDLIEIARDERILAVAACCRAQQCVGHGFQVGEHRGYIRRSEIWGIGPQEEIR